MIHSLIHQFGVFAWKMQREGMARETNEERRGDRETEAEEGVKR